jgi:hypothetical protein
MTIFVNGETREVEDGASMLDELEAQAREALIGARAEVSFKFELEQPETLYRELFQIGDDVTVRWGNYEEDLRVAGVKVNVSSSGENIKPVLEKRSYE